MRLTHCDYQYCNTTTTNAIGDQWSSALLFVGAGEPINLDACTVAHLQSAVYDALDPIAKEVARAYGQANTFLRGDDGTSLETP